MRDSRQDELHRWIAESTRTRGRVGRTTAVLAFISLSLVFAHPAVGAVALLVTAIFGGSGFWITTSHIADWNLRLDELRRRNRRRL